jgi:hypothetical protein
VATIEREGETPRLQIVGDGTLVWDKKLGVPKSLTQAMTLALNSGGTRFTLPLELTVTLQSAKTAAERQADLASFMAEQARKKSDAASSARSASSQPLSPEGRPWSFGPEANEQLDKIVQVLMASSGAATREVESSLRDLKSLAPIEARRAEVAALIEPLLAARSPSTRRAAIEAAGQWGTPAQAARLLDIVQSTEGSEREAAILALGGCGGSAEAAAYLVKYLPVSSDERCVKESLIKMGPVAEEAVWEYVGYGSVHATACQILAAIGTERSLAKLKARPPEGDISRSSAVADAIRAIEARLGRK